MSDLAVYEEQPLTAADTRAQVKLIQDVMRTVMQDGQHYGIIPGTDKPTLLKPGAEKIMATFRLTADPEVEDLSMGDIIRYRVKCRLYTKSGVFVGAGVGECSSEEEKYKWRSAVSFEEWEAAPDTHRRIKFTKKGEWKQVRTNPYDLANTILKMAKKRALVDAVLTVTAASDIFTQDFDEMPEEVREQVSEQEKPAIRKPQRKSQKDNGQPADKPAIKDPDAPVTDAQVRAIYTMYMKLGTADEDEIKSNVATFLELESLESMNDLTKEQASKVIDALNKELNG